MVAVLNLSKHKRNGDRSAPQGDGGTRAHSALESQCYNGCMTWFGTPEAAEMFGDRPPGTVATPIYRRGRLLYEHYGQAGVAYAVEPPGVNFTAGVDTRVELPPDGADMVAFTVRAVHNVAAVIRQTQPGAAADSHQLAQPQS
jgi:hypothetical protein